MKPCKKMIRYCFFREPMGSITRKSEKETIARNIMVIRWKLDKWDLTLDEYRTERNKDGGYGMTEESYFKDVYPMIETLGGACAFCKSWGEKFGEYVEKEGDEVLEQG